MPAPEREQGDRPKTPAIDLEVEATPEELEISIRDQLGSSRWAFAGLGLYFALVAYGNLGRENSIRVAGGRNARRGRAHEDVIADGPLPIRSTGSDRRRR